MNGHRLEDLLTAQMRLRNQDPILHRHNLIEIEFAIAYLTAGESNTQTACVEAWVNQLLTGTAA